MRRFYMTGHPVAVGIVVAFILFPLFLYTYKQGEIAGVKQYKQSENLMLALYSAYKDGIWESCAHPELCQQ